MAKAVPGLRRAPWLARIVAAPLPRQYGRDPARAFQKQFGRDLPTCDADMLGDDALSRILLTAAVEAARQGAAPLASELQLTFSRPWGFDPDAITSETQLCYRAEDTIAPAQMGEYLGERIPSASLTILPGEGPDSFYSASVPSQRGSIRCVHEVRRGEKRCLSSLRLLTWR